MNKRIQQLAEQANLKLDELSDDTFIPLEKFADLLIKQCGQWIVDNAGAMEHLGPEYFAQAMIKDIGNAHVQS